MSTAGLSLIAPGLVWPKQSTASYCCTQQDVISAVAANRPHSIFGSLVLPECAASCISRESGVLQRAVILLLQFCAVPTGTVYRGASIHICPSMCLQLHCLLVLWVEADAGKVPVRSSMLYCCNALMLSLCCRLLHMQACCCCYSVCSCS